MWVSYTYDDAEEDVHTAGEGGGDTVTVVVRPSRLRGAADGRVHGKTKTN